MITFVIAALAVLLVLGAAGAGFFLFRGSLTDTPPRPEGLTPETKKRLEEMGKHCDLGREIVGDLSQVNGSALWPAYRRRITDRSQRRCLRENLDGCMTRQVPLRKVYSASEYREDTASLPIAKEESRPFRPLSIHSTVKTLYIRFYLEDHNRQLLEPPAYRPRVLNLEQQAAYLDQVRPLMSQVKGVLKQVEESSDEDLTKVIYAAWSMSRPNRELREATLTLFPDHPRDHFFMAVAMEQWFHILRRTLSRYLGLLVQDYDQRRRFLVGKLRALDPLQKALEKKPLPPAFRVLYHYRVLQKGRSAECDALVIAPSGIYPVEARYFGGEESFAADSAAAAGLLRGMFLWDYFAPALEQMAPGKGSSLIQPILSVAGKAPFSHSNPCTILRPEQVRDLITSRAEIFTPKQVDELYQIFHSQGAKPSAYPLPDYQEAMAQLDRGPLREFRRLRKVAEQLPHRTYNKKK